MWWTNDPFCQQSWRFRLSLTFPNPWVYKLSHFPPLYHNTGLFSVVYLRTICFGESDSTIFSNNATWEQTYLAMAGIKWHLPHEGLPTKSSSTITSRENIKASLYKWLRNHGSQTKLRQNHLNKDVISAHYSLGIFSL